MTRVVYVILGPRLVLVEALRLGPWHRFVARTPVDATDPWPVLTDLLREKARRGRDVRVHAVLPSALHFAYEMPVIDDAADLRSAVAMKLKKDLLVPVADFVFAVARRPPHDGVLECRVAGAPRSRLAKLQAAVQDAGLSVFRVYFRDQLVEAALDGLGDSDGVVTVLADAEGLLLHLGGASGQRMHRLPCAGGDAGARAGDVLRLLGRTMAERRRLRAEPGLVEALRSAGAPDTEPLDAPCSEALALVDAHPERMDPASPYSPQADESALDFRPGRQHLAAAAVVLFLLGSLVDCWWRQSSLDEEELTLGSARDAVSRAELVIKKSTKGASELDGLERAVNLFDGEGYAPLRLLAEISAARPAATRLVSVLPQRELVSLQGRSPDRDEVFAFVKALGASELFENVTLKELAADRDGVSFRVELMRRG